VWQGWYNFEPVTLLFDAPLCQSLAEPCYCRELLRETEAPTTGRCCLPVLSGVTLLVQHLTDEHAKTLACLLWSDVGQLECDFSPCPRRSLGLSGLRLAGEKADLLVTGCECLMFNLECMVHVVTDCRRHMATAPRSSMGVNNEPWVMLALVVSCSFDRVATLNKSGAHKTRDVRCKRAAAQLQPNSGHDVLGLHLPNVVPGAH
jgi:hypothetical protein